LAGTTWVSVGDSPRPLERRIGGWTKHSVKATGRIISRSTKFWLRWVQRTLLFGLFALVVAMADKKLVNAWRLEGLRVLVTYVPLMLYVYIGLLFDRQVRLRWKALLAVTLLYGVARADILPDRDLVPGLIDDVILISIATRVFLSRCPASVVEGHATRALAWHRRVREIRDERTGRQENVKEESDVGGDS